MGRQPKSRHIPYGLDKSDVVRTCNGYEVQLGLRGQFRVWVFSGAAVAGEAARDVGYHHEAVAAECGKIWSPKALRGAS